MSESSLSSRRVAPKPAKRVPERGAKRALPPRARAGDKRPRILEAAVKVFAKNGFYATRVSDVAKAAGVADGTIYLYFKSKDELLLSLFEDRVEKLLSYMRGELPKLGGRPPSSAASSNSSSASSKASATSRRC